MLPGRTTAKKTSERERERVKSVCAEGHIKQPGYMVRASVAVIKCDIRLNLQQKNVIMY